MRQHRCEEEGGFIDGAFATRDRVIPEGLDWLALEYRHEESNEEPDNRRPNEDEDRNTKAGEME